MPRCRLTESSSNSPRIKTRCDSMRHKETQETELQKSPPRYHCFRRVTEKDPKEGGINAIPYFNMYMYVYIYTYMRSVGTRIYPANVIRWRTAAIRNAALSNLLYSAL